MWRIFLCTNKFICRKDWQLLSYDAICKMKPFQCIDKHLKAWKPIWYYLRGYPSWWTLAEQIPRAHPSGTNSAAKNSFSCRHTTAAR